MDTSPDEASQKAAGFMQLQAIDDIAVSLRRALDSVEGYKRALDAAVRAGTVPPELSAYKRIVDEVARAGMWSSARPVHDLPALVRQLSCDCSDLRRCVEEILVHPELPPALRPMLDDAWERTHTKLVAGGKR